MTSGVPTTVVYWLIVRAFGGVPEVDELKQLCSVVFALTVQVFCDAVPPGGLVISVSEYKLPFCMLNSMPVSK